MPKRTYSDDDFKKLAGKYVFNVYRNHGSTPNIKNVITEALKNHAPDRDITAQDISGVVDHLNKRNGKFNDKTIMEAAKKVIDQGAMSDLRHMVMRNAKQMGKRATEDEITAIIDKHNLNPHSASLQSIRDAVRSHYSDPRPIESMKPEEIKQLIRQEIAKHGPPTEGDVKNVLTKYMSNVDPEKPFNADEVQAIIQSYLDGIEPESGKPTAPVTQTTGKKPATQPGGSGKPPRIVQGAKVPPKDASNKTFFEKIRVKLYRYGIKSLTRGSRNWLTDNVTKLKKTPSRTKLINEGETLADALVGRMFMYFYDAKTKDELPYWDKFPLVFVTDLYADGWLGLNLHYLPMMLRVKLFDKLLQYANDKSLDKITKLRLSYSLLKAASNMPEVKPTIHRYLATQVKSKLVKIDPIDWEIAVFLPVEQFQKKKKEEVWKESKRIVQQQKAGYAKSTRQVRPTKSTSTRGKKKR